MTCFILSVSWTLYGGMCYCYSTLLFLAHINFLCHLLGVTFIIIILLLLHFSHQCELVIFHWNDSKSLQVSRSLLGILIDVDNGVVCMVLVLSLISDSSSPFSKPLGTVSSVQTRTGITIMTKSKYLSIFCLSCHFSHSAVFYLALLLG